MKFNEFKTVAAALPPLSRSALFHIVNGLYAEANFSDYDTADLARDLGVARSSIPGIMNRLEKDKIAFAEDYDNGQEEYCMIYCNKFHTDEAEDDGTWDEIRAYCKAQTEDSK